MDGVVIHSHNSVLAFFVRIPFRSSLLLYTSVIFFFFFFLPWSLLPVTGKPFDCVGMSDFYQLVVQDGVFVDKTGFIQEYIGNRKSRNLVVRPRRFGKSLNMDMLRRFLEIEVDENGDLVPEADRVNRKLFLGGTVRSPDNNEIKHLEPLFITQSVDTIKLQGQFPVIFASLKNIRGKTYRQFENNMKEYISDLFGKYRYLKRKMTEEDKEVFDLFEAGNLEEVRLDTCLDFLSTQLRAYFKRKVHILIDDYDSPLWNVLTDMVGAKVGDEKILFEAIHSQDFYNVIRLIRKIIGNSLMTSPAVEQGLLTGVFPLAETDMAPELKDIRQYSTLNHQYREHYGFFGGEVIILLNKLSLQNKSEDIEGWYKVYNSGGKLLYNAYSMMRSLQKDGNCSDYWLQTGSMQHVEHMLSKTSVQRQMLFIFAGETVSFNATYTGFKFDDLVSGELFRYLLFTGYLTPVSIIKRFNRVKLRLPNFEVESEYKKEILKWAKKKYNLSAADYAKADKLLIDGELEEFELWLKEL